MHLFIFKSIFKTALLTELFSAIRTFDLVRLEKVLESGLNLDIVYKGITPLSYASRHKDGLPLVKRLLEAGGVQHGLNKVDTIRSWLN